MTFLPRWQRLRLGLVLLWLVPARGRGAGVESRIEESDRRAHHRDAGRPTLTAVSTCARRWSFDRQRARVTIRPADRPNAERRHHRCCGGDRWRDRRARPGTRTGRGDRRPVRARALAVCACLEHDSHVHAELPARQCGGAARWTGAVPMAGVVVEAGLSRRPRQRVLRRARRAACSTTAPASQRPGGSSSREARDSSPGRTASDAAREGRSSPSSRPTVFDLADPQWLFDQQRAASLMPAFLVRRASSSWSSALGILWIVGFQHPSTRVRVREADAHEVALPTGLGGDASQRGATRAIRICRSARWLTSSAAASCARRRPTRPLCRSTSNERSARLHSHEALVVGRTSSATTVTIRRSTGSASNWPTWPAPIARPCSTTSSRPGTLTSTAWRWLRGLVRGGLVTLALGAVSLAAVLFWMSRFGPWPLAVPVSILVVGLLLVIRGAAFSILTPAGERASASWRRRLKADLGNEAGCRAADAESC